jgi:hypothetical protein
MLMKQAFWNIFRSSVKNIALVANACLYWRTHVASHHGSFKLLSTAHTINALKPPYRIIRKPSHLAMGGGGGRKRVKILEAPTKKEVLFMKAGF